MLKTITMLTAAALFALATAPATAEEKAPMPQTRGMQGMDPKLHDQSSPDPHAGCQPNADKVAQQAAHPMPQTRGMQGMDPKAHTVDCPAGTGVPDATRGHVHKAPGN